MCEHCGNHNNSHEKESVASFTINKDILSKNAEIAAHNREMLDRFGITMINIVGSPGSGKTTLLEKTIPAIKNEIKVAVIEGDVETSNDKERIEKLGIPCYQINTHGACHLEAEMVHKALHELCLDESYDLVFVENVGNLICPADFPLGEDFRVVVLSTAEGDDKPEKYPEIFFGSDAVILSKTDLIEHLDFDFEKCRERLLRVNPKAKLIALSAKNGKGIDEWLSWLSWAITKPR